MNTMKCLFGVVVCLSVMLGCRTRPITPEQSWADYCHYYSATGEKTEPSTAAADIRILKSKQAEATIAQLKSQGYAVIGSFLISDDTEITYNAVSALAQKLQASVAIWTTENVIAASLALPNPEMGVMGSDNAQVARMNADRSDMSFAEQVMTHKHTIWMLGKKAK